MDRDADKEKKYILDQYQKEQAIKHATMLTSNTPVRLALDHKLFEKRRLNFTQFAYPATLKGKLYEVKYGNDTLKVPRWKLHEGGQLEETGPVNRIIEYDEDKNMYRVEFSDDHIGYISFNRLREDPMKLHPLEKDYWKGVSIKDMPPAVRGLWKQRIRLVMKR